MQNQWVLEVTNMLGKAIHNKACIDVKLIWFEEMDRMLHQITNDFNVEFNNNISTLTVNQYIGLVDYISNAKYFC